MRPALLILLTAAGSLFATEPTSVALAPVSPTGDARAPRFTVLTPTETGVDAPNAYDDPLMWTRHYREFSLGAIGTGIAVGDIDGDDLPDLFIVNKCGPNRLYRNLGSFRFEDITANAGVVGPVDPEHWQQGAAFADIDNDGDLDLHVCRWGAPNLLYINDGTGRFTEEAAARGLAITSASSQLFFADIDNDGDLDAYLQTNLLNGEARPNGEPDFLLANDGTGHFTDVSAAAGISGDTQGHSATWWDYDQDGDLDLYVANDFKDPDTLYENRGNGTFANVLSFVVPHTPHSSMGADFGDVDNNGLPDLLVADMAATSRAKSMRGMAHIRANMETPNTHPGIAPQLMRNALFLNRDGRRMLEAATLAGLAASDWTWSVRFEDYDNDGDNDVWFTNGMVRELHSTDITGRMQKQESMAARVRIMRNTPPLAEANLAFRNDGDLRFTDVSTEWGLDQTGVSFGGVTADFDRDGDLDLVFSNYDAPATLVRNDSATGHRVLISLRGNGTTINRQALGATVTIKTASGTQTRTLVPQRGYLSSSEPILHFGLGDDDRIDELTIRWQGFLWQTFTDLAGDRHWTFTCPPKDQLTFDDSVSAVSIDSGFDSPVVRSHETNPPRSPQATELPYLLDRLGPGVAIGDINGDAIDDVIVGGTTGHPGEVRTSVSANRWTPSNFTLFSGTTTVADAQPLLVEINGDGHPDLLLPQTGDARPAGDRAYQPLAFLNDGRGGFDRAPAGTVPELSISVGAAVAADFDRDGDLDVFLGARQIPGAYPEAATSALLINEGGRFTLGTLPAAAHGLITSALATDVDGDGWLDLLLAREWDTVAYLHNDSGQGFTDHSVSSGFAAAGSGWWNSLAAADFNGDGRLDYAVGNLGLNTPYQAPFSLLRGVFEDGGHPVLIETINEGGQLYPRRSLTVLGSLIRSLARKVRSHDAYATMTVADLVGADRVTAAQTYTVTETRSGVFLSQPDGIHTFVPLPRLAQLAPTYGLVAVDFDGDTFTDLVGVQNLYSVRPETGRFDGGLGFVAYGNGRGEFSLDRNPQPTIELDAKSLALIDLQRDGRPDLYVTRNHSDTVILDTSTGTFLALRPLGPPANPTGIGTRVTVVYSDSHSTTHEVAAGGGHRSQSTPTMFFGYDPTTPPLEIIFRWPDGTTNTLPWPAEPPPILNIRIP